MTIGHEIGHVFVGYGHPDDRQSPGDYPLHGTEHLAGKRLMCSGPVSSSQSRLLVKGEWDEAETWLQEREQNGGLGQ
jgi:hypothetical protein